MTSMSVASSSVEAVVARAVRSVSISVKAPTPISARIVSPPARPPQATRKRSIDIASPAMAILMKILSTQFGRSDEGP